MSSQRIGKYACLEVERKYLLDQPPAGLLEQGYRWQIVDRYITNTRLRLRRITSISGQQLLKFTQKYQDAGQDETQTTITNMYLDEGEYRHLAQLPASEIVKKRYHYDFQNHQYRIDIFEGKLAGLILAEIELERVEDIAGLSFPPFALAEVTADLFFTGGNLATLAEEKLKNELVKWLRKKR